MDMGINKLTALEVKRAKAVNDKGEPVASRRYSDGGGLYLEVIASGAKSWVFMWKRNGRRRCMGLGSANTISLVEARDLATEARKVVNANRDPISDRKKARARAITFSEAAKQCHADIGAEWKAERYRQKLAIVTDHPCQVAGQQDSRRDYCRSRRAGDEAAVVEAA